MRPLKLVGKFPEGRPVSRTASKQNPISSEKTRRNGAFPFLRLLDYYESILAGMN
jgi:hypothetical protein